MVEQTDRKRFEEWAENNLPSNSRGEHYCMEGNDPYEIWQAALASERKRAKVLAEALRYYATHPRSWISHEAREAVAAYEKEA